MKLTEQIIHSAGTNGIGFNFHQLYVLGVQWPPKHGWIQDLVGKEVTDEVWRLVLSLKGKRRSERRLILQTTPFRKEIFSRKSDLKARVLELEELIAYVRENVTIEIAAHGDCQCDVPAGDCPCVYCASIHFNESTDTTHHQQH